MAIFEVVEGAPGQGKSLYTAQLAQRLLERNLLWERKRQKRVAELEARPDLSETQRRELAGLLSRPRRKLYSNLRFSEAFERKWEGWIEYWVDAEDLTTCHDCDIIWDEIATELDSRNWVNLADEMKRFLSQYRKRGVDIYANTQDFSMIDVRARLMISGVKTLTKVIGSSDISSTKPPPKYIWGVVMVRTVENYRETSPDRKRYSFLPSFFLITRELVEIYDTRQDIKAGGLLAKRRHYREVEFVGGPRDGQREGEYTR